MKTFGSEELLVIEFPFTGFKDRMSLGWYIAGLNISHCCFFWFP